MPSEELVVGALRGVGCGCLQRSWLWVPSEELVVGALRGVGCGWSWLWVPSEELVVGALRGVQSLQPMNSYFSIFAWTFQYFCVHFSIFFCTLKDFVY